MPRLYAIFTSFAKLIVTIFFNHSARNLRLMLPHKLMLQAVKPHNSMLRKSSIRTLQIDEVTGVGLSALSILTTGEHIHTGISFKQESHFEFSPAPRLTREFFLRVPSSKL